MNIIVAGCGKIGTSVISRLVLEGHDVVAVDESADVITEVTNIYDIMGVTGNAADCDTLSEAGAQNADMFVAMMDSDELNMLSCLMAKRLGVQNTIARIRNPEYNDESLGFMTKNLEISMSINPELLTAAELYNILKFPSAVRIESFSRRSLQLMEILLAEDSELCGTKLLKFREKFGANVLVCCVQRGGEVYIPGGNFELQAGDRVGFIGSPPELYKLFKELGISRKRAKNTMILGASRIAYYLARAITSVGNSAKVIEIDPQKCEEFADALPKASVILGDGIKQELLFEEGLATADAFVSLTGLDEANILTALFAGMQNVPKVIAKINSDELASMAGKIGVDTIVSPKNITSDVVVKYARALQNSFGSNVETLYKLMEGNVEALEFIVKADSKVTNVPLKDLKFKKGILIGGIMRDKKTIIPGGLDEIKVGDRIVVIASDIMLNDLADILK